MIFFLVFLVFCKANLRLDRRIKKSEKIKLVQEILIQLGLMACIDNRIGHTHKGKALSGGEKKRLSFASEMLTKPPLLFCDEPTTGLGTYHKLPYILHIPYIVADLFDVNFQMPTVPRNLCESYKR